MRYFCEDLMSTKSILHSDRQIAILVDLLMYTQMFIDISYDPMQISCPQCSHVDWVWGESDVRFRRNNGFLTEDDQC